MRQMDEPLAICNVTVSDFAGLHGNKNVDANSLSFIAEIASPSVRNALTSAVLPEIVLLPPAPYEGMPQNFHACIHTLKQSVCTGSCKALNIASSPFAPSCNKCGSMSVRRNGPSSYECSVCHAVSNERSLCFKALFHSDVRNSVVNIKSAAVFENIFGISPTIFTSDNGLYAARVCHILPHSIFTALYHSHHAHVLTTLLLFQTSIAVNGVYSIGNDNIVTAFEKAPQNPPNLPPNANNSTPTVPNTPAKHA